MVGQNQYLAILYAAYPTLLKIFFSVPEKEVKLRVGISSEYYYGRYKSRASFSEKATGGQGGGGGGLGYLQVSLMACTGRLLQKGVSFSGFRYMKEKRFH